MTARLRLAVAPANATVELRSAVALLDAQHKLIARLEERCAAVTAERDALRKQLDIWRKTGAPGR